MTVHPIYRRFRPKNQDATQFNFGSADRLLIDLADTGIQKHLPAYPFGGPSDPVSQANSLFDTRAAAAVAGCIGDPAAFALGNLLEAKVYVGGLIYIVCLGNHCMAAMAYADYFPDSPDSRDGEHLQSLVAQAIMQAQPGWCGTFGPGTGGVLQLIGTRTEGNYDFDQMRYLPIAYGYYDELETLIPGAGERLIRTLLALGTIHRPGLDDTLTNAGTPHDWSRAGSVTALAVDIPETENHVLMIATARYLTNQLLYQRTYHPQFDNRRNGSSALNPLFDQGRPNCFDQIMMLLQIMLINDFAEYNSKNYQEETRWALVNLCSYAYDSEVRLAARMVLDYVSAHIAVSSNDLRRFVPFRRRNQGLNTLQLSDNPGFMNVALLGEGSTGSDPMAPYFALLAGNTRVYETAGWKIKSAAEYVQEVLSDYRLPASIHDLFVNDMSRRFFQRLHRFPRHEPGDQRNCDNMEIYAGSPSYLISAGGKPAKYVIEGYGPIGYDPSNKGVAVPTSFMPTGKSAGLGCIGSKDLIQLSRFSDIYEGETPLAGLGGLGGTENYGVAPDFACGYGFHLPSWVRESGVAAPPFTEPGTPNPPGFHFIDKKSRDPLQLAGFYLAIYLNGDFILLEAFDTWLHPEVDFETFKKRVWDLNSNIHISNNVEAVYTTLNGNQIRFVIWKGVFPERKAIIGSKILKIDYGRGDPRDTLVDAGDDTEGYLRGTVLNSPREAVVEITNTSLRTTIRLDLSDRSNPKRIVEVNSEEIEREEAGKNHELWVDFSSPVAEEAGDFFQPFKTLAAAVNAVAEEGTIKIMPGKSSERIPISKRVKIIAPIGGVTLG